MDAQSAEWQIRPLTHTSRQSGLVYRRESDVEQQVARAVQLDPESLAGTAGVREKDSAEYLKEESLVYLIREFHRQGQIRLREEMSRELLDRCLPFVRAELRTLGADRAEEAESEIVLKMFTKLLDLDGDTGDFYQVRFWLALERLVADNRRKQITQQKRDSKTVAPPWTSGGEDDHGDNPAPGSTEREPFEMPDMSSSLLMREALGRLKDNQRLAFVMRNYCGWPIEAQESGSLTISSYFKKDPRTIRNWLGEADRVLLAWREERS